MRLNKFIALSGICSRRKADEHIKNGEVIVNGEVIYEMGHKVSRKDKVKFKGKLVSPEKKVYILLNKPKDAICTTKDPRGRRTVLDLLGYLPGKPRLYPVGRLDRNTTGLLLLTNDGELAQRLAHPSNEVRKLYSVELDRQLTPKDFEKIKSSSVELEEGTVPVDDLNYINGTGKKGVGIQIHIGWNRVVRRTFESLGYKIKKLDRVLYAHLTKKDLPRSKWRFLKDKEVITLKYMNIK